MLTINFRLLVSQAFGLVVPLRRHVPREAEAGAQLGVRQGAGVQAVGRETEGVPWVERWHRV